MVRCPRPALRVAADLVLSGRRALPICRRALAARRRTKGWNREGEGPPTRQPVLLDLLPPETQRHAVCGWTADNEPLADGTVPAQSKQRQKPVPRFARLSALTGAVE